MNGRETESNYLDYIKSPSFNLKLDASIFGLLRAELTCLIIRAPFVRPSGGAKGLRTKKVTGGAKEEERWPDTRPEAVRFLGQKSGLLRKGKKVTMWL